MRIQILKEKNTNKVRGWGSGQAYYSADECETVIREMPNKDFEKLYSGDYYISELDMSGEIVIKEVSRGCPANTIKQKIEEGTATIEDLKEAVKNLL